MTEGKQHTIRGSLGTGPRYYSRTRRASYWLAVPIGSFFPRGLGPLLERAPACMVKLRRLAIFEGGDGLLAYHPRFAIGQMMKEADGAGGHVFGIGVTAVCGGRGALGFSTAGPRSCGAVRGDREPHLGSSRSSLCPAGSGGALGAANGRRGVGVAEEIGPVFVRVSDGCSAPPALSRPHLPRLKENRQMNTPSAVAMPPGPPDGYRGPQPRTPTRWAVAARGSALS
ncbi:unnamed protein product [Gadus morhua 'NCC']